MPAAARIGATLRRGGVAPPRGFPSAFFWAEPGWQPCQDTRVGKDATGGAWQRMICLSPPRCLRPRREARLCQRLGVRGCAIWSGPRLPHSPPKQRGFLPAPRLQPDPATVTAHSWGLGSPETSP